MILTHENENARRIRESSYFLAEMGLKATIIFNPLFAGFGDPIW